jgi:hypothetical protein
MIHRTLAPFLLAALTVVFVAGPAGAAENPVPLGDSTGSGSPALFANYWTGFVDHWSGVFKKQNGIVLGTLLVGAVCLFIITRGKWKKE